MKPVPSDIALGSLPGGSVHRVPAQYPLRRHPAPKESSGLLPFRPPCLRKKSSKNLQRDRGRHSCGLLLTVETVEMFTTEGTSFLERLTKMLALTGSEVAAAFAPKTSRATFDAELALPDQKLPTSTPEADSAIRSQNGTELIPVSLLMNVITCCRVFLLGLNETEAGFKQKLFEKLFLFRGAVSLGLFLHQLEEVDVVAREIKVDARFLSGYEHGNHSKPHKSGGRDRKKTSSDPVSAAAPMSNSMNSKKSGARPSLASRRESMGLAEPRLRRGIG